MHNNYVNKCLIRVGHWTSGQCCCGSTLLRQVDVSLSARAVARRYLPRISGNKRRCLQSIKIHTMPARPCLVWTKIDTAERGESHNIVGIVWVLPHSARKVVTRNVKFWVSYYSKYCYYFSQYNFTVDCICVIDSSWKWSLFESCEYCAGFKNLVVVSCLHQHMLCLIWHFHRNLRK